MPRFYLVDLESITCNQPRSQFAIEKIEDLAKSIATMGSLVQPIILEATSRQTYKLLAGALEYYAAIRASEINPDIEMVDSFVVEPEKIEQAQEQLTVLNSVSVTLPPSSLPQPTSDNNIELERRVNNMEARFEQSLQDFKALYEDRFQTL
ncbi:MAG: ParB N-terminal domain-containing protein, partial [Prochlorothrix sp.]